MNDAPTREEIVESLQANIPPNVLEIARRSEEALMIVLTTAYQLGRLDERMRALRETDAEIRALRGKL